MFVTKKDKLGLHKRASFLFRIGSHMKLRYLGGYTAAFIAVGFGWLIFSWPWLSGDVTIPYDAKAHFQPQLQFLANALHTGQSPFWAPNVFGGSPQIADPQSLIFSPAFLLAYLDPAPSFRQLDFYCFLLLGIAAFAVLMLFRDRGWHPAAATVAALGAAFGGSAIWRIQHIAQIEAFAFFMLCLWLLARALDRKSILYGTLAGVAASGMIIQPGQIALIGAYVLLGYTVHHWIASPRFWPAVRQSILPLAGGTVAATLIAAGPILLAFLFVEHSNRPEIPFDEAARGALHPASLLTTLIPDLFGVKTEEPYWGPASIEWPADWLAMTENMGQLYIGALPVLLLLGVGFLKGRIFAREIRFFTLAITGLLLYALGRYTGAFTLLYYYLPGVDMFRRPADATYALCAMTAILGGYMLHRVLTGADELTREQTKWLAVAVGGLCLTGLGVAAFHEHLLDAMEPVALALAVFAVAWGTLAFARRHAAGQGALAVLALGGFMTADLVINNGPNRSTALPPSTYDELRVDSKNDTLALLKERLSQRPGSDRRDRVEMVGLGFEWPNTSLVHGFDHSLGYNPLRIAEFVEAMGDVETTAETYQRDFTRLFPSYRSTLADMMGIRYIAIDEPIEHLDKQLKPGDLKLVAHTKDAYIYENPRALPRVLFAFDWQPANFAQLKKDGRWPVFDPRRTVLFHAERPQTVVLPPKPVSMPEARTSLRSYRNTVVEIEVETSAPGFVVLNDNWHPWWFATVDGKPTDIYRANVLFRAVQVPSGRHLVRFEFKPVEGAVREVRARLEGKSLEPGLPPRMPRIRPEASLPVSPRPAG